MFYFTQLQYATTENDFFLNVTVRKLSTYCQKKKNVCAVHGANNTIVSISIHLYAYSQYVYENTMKYIV